jgi:PAS domain-containing protein
MAKHLDRMAGEGLALPSGPSWEAFLADIEHRLSATAPRDRFEHSSALSASTNRMLALMENLQAAILVESPDHQVALANSAFCQIFGRNRSGLMTGFA